MLHDCCAPIVRRITRRRRERFGRRTSGSTAYPQAKAQRDRSMPVKRGRSEDAYGRAAQDPRDRGKTTLCEPQPPVMHASILRHSV